MAKKWIETRLPPRTHLRLWQVCMHTEPTDMSLIDQFRPLMRKLPFTDAEMERIHWEEIPTTDPRTGEPVVHARFQNEGEIVRRWRREEVRALLIAVKHPPAGFGWRVSEIAMYDEIRRQLGEPSVIPDDDEEDDEDGEVLGVEDMNQMLAKEQEANA